MTTSDQNNTKPDNIKGRITIGQIVYVLSNKNQSIFPAMVVEESIIKTLDSEVVSWKLAFGAKNKPNKPQKIVDSAKVDGEIFSDLADIYRILEARLESFLNSTISDAQKKEKIWFGTESKISLAALRKKSPESSVVAPVQERSPEKKEKNVSQQQAPAKTQETVEQNGKIDLGTFLDDDFTSEDESIKVHIENNIIENTPAPISEEEAKEKLRRAVMGDDEDDMLNVPGGSHEDKIPMDVHIDGPNGIKIPVNFRR